MTEFINKSTVCLYLLYLAKCEMNSKNHKYALLLMAVVAMTATGALAQAYAQQITDGMDGYVVGDPDGGAGIYTRNLYW